MRHPLRNASTIPQMHRLGKTFSGPRQSLTASDRPYRTNPGAGRCRLPVVFRWFSSDVINRWAVQHRRARFTRRDSRMPEPGTLAVTNRSTRPVPNETDQRPDAATVGPARLRSGLRSSHTPSNWSAQRTLRARRARTPDRRRPCRRTWAISIGTAIPRLWRVRGRTALRANPPPDGAHAAKV